jgi:hypothetical protein
VKEVVKDLIESPQAAKSGCQRDFGHRHPRFVDQLFGKEHTSRLRHRNRRCSQMLKEQSPKLALAQAKSFRQRFHACALAIESAIGDKSQRPRDGV